MIEDPEDFVTRELGRYGLRCVRFSKKEMGVRKTPDRRVYHGGGLAFFLEIKEIKHDSWARGARPSPIFNRLTDDIHTAVKQFGSVNPDLEHPNVLAFVNNDRRCGSLDLIGVTTGHLLLKGAGVAPIYLNYSEGRIRDEKHRIHLYLWFDCRAFKADHKFFNMFDTRHLARLCEYFGIRPDALTLIDV